MSELQLPDITGDRLYGIEMRPQELALFGERVHFDIRYSPIADDMDEPITEHYKLLVLEIFAHVDADDDNGREGGRFDLLKCGWELQLQSHAPCAPKALPERPDEVRLLLGQVAETINDLAKRAGLEAPMGPILVDELLAEYQQYRDKLAEDAQAEAN